MLVADMPASELLQQRARQAPAPGGLCLLSSRAARYRQPAPDGRTLDRKRGARQRTGIGKDDAKTEQRDVRPACAEFECRRFERRAKGQIWERAQVSRRDTARKHDRTTPLAARISRFLAAHARDEQVFRGRTY